MGPQRIKEGRGQKTYTFGTCHFERMSPPKEGLSPEKQVLNIYIPYEEVLKHMIAVQECARKLHGYKRSTKEGQRAAMNLTVHLGLNRVAVNEGRI